MRTNHIFYIAIAAVSIVVFSCSDDMLEKKPLNGYSELDVFVDAALLEDFVNGTYRGLRHSFDDENTLTDGLTDNAYNQHGSAADVRRYTAGETTEDNGEAVTRNLWTGSYQNIRRTNLFFEKTVDSPIDPVKLGPLQGEMHFLRAYFYFDLLRWYGGVPLITKTFTLGEDYDITRNSADEIANFVVAECDLAIATLRTLDAAEYKSGKASVEAAMALKARTLLYIASPLFNEANNVGKWTTARDANKAVMDLTTVAIEGITAADYGAMFRGQNDEEVIMSRYFTQTINQGWGVNTWLFPNSEGGWSNTTPTQNLVDNYELINGELPSSPTSGYDDQDPYVDRDPRFYQSILFNGAPFKSGSYDYFVDQVTPANSGKDSPSSSTAPWNSSKTGYNFRKWSQEDKAWDAGNLGPWILFRKSEFYLNYAEAQIALGEDEEARDAINAVRGRIGMPDVTESGAALLERYQRERRIELVLEDHRFFDIRRWKIGPDALDIPAMGVNVYKNGSTISYVYDKVADGTRQWVDKMYLLPIPSQEVQRSHEKLTQNPDY